ncbi:MAG: peptidase M10 [Bacteroidetes bacterium]|nr:peptidase M10 [Bacteroidota bacterium]
MGEAELSGNRLIIHASIIIYGDAATASLAETIAGDIAHYWNEPEGTAEIHHHTYAVEFAVKGFYNPALTPVEVYENTNPRNNYFRIETEAHGNISSVDGLGSNTGYFKLDNLLHHSTTAAHEFGHTLGLDHPRMMDIRGEGQPGIMYPRGTIVDAVYQYDPAAKPHGPGGTINPHTRRVLQKDIDHLKLNKLRFNTAGFAVVGEFSSVWHEKYTES